MKAELCFFVCMLACAALLVNCSEEVIYIPSLSMETPTGSVCPADDLMNGIRGDISNKISDILRAKMACGGSGWRRVAYINMRDPNTTCPDQWRLYEQRSLRLCGRQTYAAFSCDSVQFGTGGRAYTKVCGRITGYQYGSPDGAAHSSTLINEAYLDGISVTYGQPRKHIWSFFAVDKSARCCSENHMNKTKLLSFVGNQSFCDTGNVNDASRWQNVLFTNHPLWEGVAGCAYSATCCHVHSGPWFQTSLPAPTASDIEVRICSDQHTDNEDTPLELVEIYVQ